MTDILICPCINLFWKAVRPCKEERWSSFSQCADRVLPSHRHTRALCTSSPRLSSPRSVPPVPSWSTRKVFYSFVFHSYNKIQLLFFSLPGFPAIFKSVFDSVLFLPGVCLQSYCYSQIFPGEILFVWQQTSSPGVRWSRNWVTTVLHLGVFQASSLQPTALKGPQEALLLVSAADLPRNFPFLPQCPAPDAAPLIPHLTSGTIPWQEEVGEA